MKWPLLRTYCWFRTVSGRVHQSQRTLDSLSGLVHRRVRTWVRRRLAYWLCRSFKWGRFRHLGRWSSSWCEGIRRGYSSCTLIRLSALNHRVIVIVALEEFLDGFASQHFLVFLLYFRIFLIFPAILTSSRIKVIFFRLRLISLTYIWHVGCSQSLVE